MVHIHHSQPLKIKFGKNHFLGSATLGPKQYRKGVNDLKDKIPPYKCPISGCSFQTKLRLSWLRHYGIMHGLNEKYLKEYKEKKSVGCPDFKINFYSYTEEKQKASTQKSTDCHLCVWSTFLWKIKKCFKTQALFKCSF